MDRLGGGSPEQAPRRVETSVRGPTGTDEMDVDSNYVLFVDNIKKNESAKLEFFAEMDHQSVSILGSKVEEYTYEGTMSMASSVTLSNGPYLPLTTTDSSDQMEGGTAGGTVRNTSDTIWDLHSPVALSKGPYRPPTATGSADRGEEGTNGTIGSHPRGARKFAKQRDGTGDVESLDRTEGDHAAAQSVGTAEACIPLRENLAGGGSHQGTDSDYDAADGAAPNSLVYRKAGGASGGGSRDSTALASYTGGGDAPGTGVTAILRVEDDLRKDRENREALVDALLVQEILSSVIHYFAAALSEDERQAIIDLIVDSIIDCDLNYGEKAAIKWGDGFKWRQETLDTDLALFMQSGMDIKVMAATRLAALKHDRLNPQRVESLRADNPERQRLLGLCEGMVVPKPEGFIPNGATSSKGLHKV